MRKVKFFYALAALFFCLPLATAEAAPIDDLCAAAQWVMVEDARSAVAAGADVNERGCTAMSTPLHRAAWAGSYSAEALNVVTLLVEEGANLEARESGGQTPLHLAAVNTYRAGTRIVDYLIAQGANVNARDDRGTTPLVAGMLANILNRSRAVFTVLLKAGANPNLADNRGVAPLHVAAGLDSSPYFYTSTLLTEGANPNQADNAGRTPLHNAAQWGLPSVVDLLLAAGANVHAQTRAGETALDVAQNNSVSLALLNRGACGLPSRWDANAGECAIPPAPPSGGGGGGGGGGGAGIIAAGAVLMLGAAWVFSDDAESFSFAPRAFYAADDGLEFSGYGGRLDWRGAHGSLFWEARRDNPGGASNSRLDWEYGGALNLWRGLQVDGAVYAGADSNSDGSDIAEWRAGMEWEMEWDANHFVFRADKASERKSVPWRMEWSAAPLFSRFQLRSRFYAAGEDALRPGAQLRAGANVDAEMLF